MTRRSEQGAAATGPSRSGIIRTFEKNYGDKLETNKHERLFLAASPNNYVRPQCSSYEAHIGL